MQHRLVRSLPAAGIALAGLIGVVVLAIACAPPPGGGGATTTTASTASTTTIVGEDCPIVAADLSTAPGAGPGYAAPSVSASCSDTELLMQSNGMPGYTFQQTTPNPLGVQDWHWHVPRYPALAASPTPVSNWFGTIGFTVTGLPIYAAMEGAQPANEAFGDPVHNGILDGCDGHTGPNREYHYHALRTAASCLLVEPLLGYALDGFPIYGPLGCLDAGCSQVVTFRSGYVQTADPTTNAWSAYTYQSSADPTVLDACNGRVGPDGSYRYYATSGFPYTVGCFAGVPTTQGGAAGGPMPPM